MAGRIAVLYAKRDSIYHQIAGLDVYDAQRDARTFAGGMPVIAHPPCRGWGRYSHKAKAGPEELKLAFHALNAVRMCGGVLEHPACSKFWNDARLPRPGEFPDRFGGYTIAVNQVDWGHRGIKPTWLYVVGVEPDDLPDTPPPGQPQVAVQNMWRGEREATPKRFALWLTYLVSRVDRWVPVGR